MIFILYTKSGLMTFTRQQNTGCESRYMYGATRNVMFDIAWIKWSFIVVFWGATTTTTMMTMTTITTTKYKS